MTTLLIVAAVLAVIVLARVLVLIRQDTKVLDDEDLFTRARQSRRRR